MGHPTREHRSNLLHCGFVLVMVMSTTALYGCAGADVPQESIAAAASAELSLSAKKNDPSVVKVATGAIRGNVASAYRQFLGIPYAAAPTGSLRWKPPAPAPSWRGVRDASLPKDMCPQYVYTAPRVGSPGGNEDCLFLNVATPNKPNLKKLPVMVWIHGGGYTNGSGVEQDGTSLVQKANVIVVTLNYRLGALGFLAHPALTAESRDNSGNFGLLDQQAALAWVKENIAQFGGDPSNVTIFGVSAGGNSIWAHMISPKSAGLFQRAISISGLWATSWNWMGYDEPAQPFKLSDAEAIGTRFAEAMGCTGTGRSAARCLRNATVADLVETGGADMGPAYFIWGPTAGGAVMPRQLKEALTAGAFNRVPIINGSTHDEAMPYVMMPFWVYMNNPLTPEVYAQTLVTRFGDDASTVQAQYPVGTYGSATYAYSAVDTDLQNSCYTRTINGLAAAYTKVYAYEFNDPNAPYSFFWTTVFGGSLPYAPRAYHASDVPYIFPSPDNTEGLVPEQIQLSDHMIEYYTSFAKSGAPQGQTTWLPYDRTVDAVQSLAPNAIAPITSFASDHQCAFWAKPRGI
jgi:para-nitrobenzyl esterase